LGKLEGEHLPEKRAHADACKKIAAAPNLASALIVADVGRVQGQFHEAGERNRPKLADFLLYLTRQRIH
jgi:hypothetical protein